MPELTMWIDESFQILSENESFKAYFSKTELQNIEDTFFVSNKTEGIDVTFTEGLLVKSVHLSSGKYLNDEYFKGELPFDLNFDFTREIVKKLMGLPDTSGGNIKNSVLGYINKWDKYFFDTFSIHLQYSKNEDYIELITIGSLKFEENALPE